MNITNPGKNANICQSFIYSPGGDAINNNQENGNVVVYDIWGNWSPTFVANSALTLGFNFDFGYNSQDGNPVDLQATSVGSVPVANSATPHGGSETWWGAALYAQYHFSKVFSIEGRGEYLHSSSAFNPLFGATGLTDAVGDSIATPSQDDWSATLTATFNIWDNLLTRVEYRADILSAGSGLTSTGINPGTGLSQTVLNGSSVQNEVSLEAVYSF